MSYSDQMTLSLGAVNAGKTLVAALKDGQTGVLLTGHESILSGFTDLGEGHYLWGYDSFPEEQRVLVEFRELGQTELLAVSAPMDAWGAGAMIDGVSPYEMAEILLSTLAGTSVLVDHGNGTKTLSYRKQDGATDRLSVTFDALGQWQSTNLHTA